MALSRNPAFFGNNDAIKNLSQDEGLKGFLIYSDSITLENIVN